MTINVFIAVREDAQALIVERLQWDTESQGEYSGLVTDRQAKLFALMQDQTNRQELYRIDVDAGRSWWLWTVDFDFPGDILQKVKAEIDQLIIDYPNHIRVGGAWHWSDGRQVTGYPLHSRLIEFMPDIDDIGTRPLTLSDVNLMQGQEERQFV